MCAAILVIDDTSENREKLRTILTQAGHTVEEAGHGVDGLLRLDEARFDLIISDLAMPVMDGYELAHRIRQNPDLAETPIIFASATYAIASVIALAKAVDVRYIIPAGTDPETTTTIVTAALNKQPLPWPSVEPAAAIDLDALIVQMKQHVTRTS